MVAAVGRRGFGHQSGSMGFIVPRMFDEGVVYLSNPRHLLGSTSKRADGGGRTLDYRRCATNSCAESPTSRAMRRSKIGDKSPYDAQARSLRDRLHDEVACANLAGEPP